MNWEEFKKIMCWSVWIKIGLEEFECIKLKIVWFIELV